MHQQADVVDVSYRKNSAYVCRQLLLMKAAMLLFCTKCSETQVATSSLI